MYNSYEATKVTEATDGFALPTCHVMVVAKSPRHVAVVHNLQPTATAHRHNKIVIY